MDDFFAFGDIFTLGEKEYVYFGINPDKDILYVALICDDRQTRMFVDFCDREQSKGGANAIRVTENKVYCFVILETDQFKGRAAHYHQPGMTLGKRRAKIGTLDEADIESLKKEIRGSRGVDLYLKKIIEQLG